MNQFKNLIQLIVMRSLNIDQIEEILTESPFEDFKSSTLVETGTYEGGTVFSLHEYFMDIYTIELNKRSYNFCVNKSKDLGIENINFYNGQSQDILPKLITEKLNDMGTCIFFLDAHYTYNQYGLTSKGDIDVPVLLEIDIISKLFKNQCIIIIDDATAMGNPNLNETAQADWSKISHLGVLKSIGNRKHSWEYFDSGSEKRHDRLILYVDNIESKETTQIENFI